MRHPWRAVVAWVAFVAAALALGIGVGTKPLQNGAVGESARGYSLLDKYQAWPPAREYAYLHSDTLRAQDQAFRAAVADVARRMKTGLGSAVTTRVSADGHSVLVA